MGFDHYQRAIYYAKRTQRWEKVYIYFLRSSKEYNPMRDRIMKDAHYAAIGCAKAAAYHLNLNEKQGAKS